MDWTITWSYFIGAAFLTNAMPHLMSGVMGRTFQSPFATPRGVGHSSSTVNMVWGFFNLVVAYILLCRTGNFDLHSTADVVPAGAGILISGVLMARRFGRFNGGNSPPANRSGAADNA
jgi:hypothetical protein